VVVAEKYAYGEVTDEELERAANVAYEVCKAEFKKMTEQGLSFDEQMARRTPSLAADNSALPTGWWGGAPGLENPCRILLETSNSPAIDDALYSNLLREIFGNPFRAIVFDPNVASATCNSFASFINAECAFDRLPILADMLEESGVVDAYLLSHLRRPDGHVKGCWALDAVLGYLPAAKREHAEDAQ
jgi:hypothetical protein